MIRCLRIFNCLQAQLVFDDHGREGIREYRAVDFTATIQGASLPLSGIATAVKTTDDKAGIRPQYQEKSM